MTMSRFLAVIFIIRGILATAFHGRPSDLYPFVTILAEVEEEGSIPLGVEAVRERHVDATIDDRLRHHDRDRRVVADAAGDLTRLLQRLALLGHVIEDAVTLGFGGCNPATGPHQLLGKRLAYQPRQRLRSTAARHHAELDLGKAELRVRAGHNNVSNQRELKTAAQSETLDRDNQRLGEPADVLEQAIHLPGPLAKTVEIKIAVFLDLKFAGIDTGAKCLLAAEQNDCPHVPVVLDFIENPEDFVGCLFSQRIQLLGPIDRDFDPPLFSVEDNVLVTHVSSPPMISMFGWDFSAHGGCDLSVEICDLARVRPRLVADAVFESYLGRRAQHQRAVSHLECVVDAVSNEQTGLLEFARDLEKVPAQGL